MEKILTVNDVAAILQVKAITVREMFREKRLRGFKVGKSWRTTEVMLQEDISALARGEAPAELKSAGPPAAPQGSGMAPPPAAAPRVDREQEVSRKPRPARKPPVADREGDEDDTQQMLF